jgi:rare lipoprotein A
LYLDKDQLLTKRSPLLKRVFAIFISSIIYISAGAQEAGLASYYNDYFTGKTTASGEKYDPNKLTAAHKSLPIGTMIKVTNLANDKSVIVRVNDRGPYVKGRILDLSKSAAIQLGLLQSGFARVSYTIMETNILQIKDTASAEETPDEMFYSINAVDTSVKMGWGVKLGSFDDPALAFKVSKELRLKYEATAFIQTVKLIKGCLYRIFVGNYATQEEAEQLRSVLKKAYPECKVISYSTFK